MYIVRIMDSQYTQTLDRAFILALAGTIWFRMTQRLKLSLIKGGDLAGKGFGVSQTDSVGLHVQEMDD